MRATRTTTSWAIRTLATTLTIASGFCPQPGAAAQAITDKRYEAIVRTFNETTRPPAPLVGTESAWTLKLALAPSTAGALDDDRIYLPLREKLLVALDRETGLLKWTRPLDTAVAPTVGDGRVFIASDNAISCLDGATGMHLWSAPMEAALAAPLVWDAGWVIALGDAGDVFAFRAADGRLMWRRLVGSTSSHAAVPGGRNALYLSLSDGRVVALALQTGDLLWERKLSGTLSQPATGRDRVFVGSTDNYFYALNAESGAEEWKWRNGGDVIGAAVDGDLVYFVSLDNIIRAVNRGNGNQRWRKPTGTRPVLPPRAFQGIVVLPGLMPAITVFVGETGAVMGTQTAAGDLIGPPLVDPAPKPFRVAIITITREGVVEALRPTSLMFREEKAVAVSALPGRALARERIE
ncbi:MAG: PQQ-binding-like beta-propeller repeat protein [Vicinamibacterales bacterium]